MIEMNKLKLYGKRNIIYKAIMYLFRLFPIDDTKIVVSNFRGKGFYDNPKYIVEKLHEMNESYKIFWLVADDINDLPSYIYGIRIHSIKSLFHLATAAIWIDNCRKPLYVTKRKKQYYIQTWHAGISYKLGEAYAIKSLSNEYILAAQKDSEMANLFLSNSEWLSKSYIDSFWYKGEIFKKGLPREDVLFENPNKYYMQVCHFYKSSDNTRFLLYAPTFRKNNDISAYDVNYDRLIDTLNKSTGEQWKVIVRLHPNVASQKDIIDYNIEILNGSDYPDINHLILASSIVISDYSSCIFDAMLAKKYVLIYASDMRTYDRNLAFEWNELPFLISENNDELIQNVVSFDEGVYRTKVKNFCEKCGFYESGHAAEEVAKHILYIKEK